MRKRGIELLYFSLEKVWENEQKEQQELWKTMAHFGHYNIKNNFAIYNSN